jgi:hypothetical protein
MIQKQDIARNFSMEAVQEIKTIFIQWSTAQVSVVENQIHVIDLIVLQMKNVNCCTHHVHQEPLHASLNQFVRKFQMTHVQLSPVSLEQNV